MNMEIKKQLLLLGVITAWLFVLGVARAQTVVWSENFDDGNGNSRWYADSGVWQIGSPTVGPSTNSAGYRTHSGPYCGTTGLTGNYVSYQDSRLIRIATFTVPATNQFPRLRFWQWFSFAGSYNGDGGSYGYVEVRVGAGSWQQISPKYSGNSSAVWSQPSLDLSAFAGQTIQIAFHFHSGNYTDVGWYVDDISLLTGTPVFNNPESFELGMGDWASESGTWVVGVPTAGPGQAYAGTNCAATGLTGNYGSYVDTRFTSPTFTVPASNNYPRLRFSQWFSFAGSYNGDGGSYGYVEIRVGTNNWQTISPNNYSSSSSGVWSQPSIDISAYGGQSVQVAFHFHSGNYTAAGWYIDQVLVSSGVPTMNNPEGFESGLGDWQVDHGTWQVGVPTSGPGSAHSGTNCGATVLTGNYASYVDSSLISPPFILPSSGQSPYLRFWHWFSFAGSYNGDGGSSGKVQIKAGTNAWQVISPIYSGQSGAWTEPFIDLTSYGGQTVQLAFTIHSGNYVNPGWYVDDVQIYPNITNLPPPPPINPSIVIVNTNILETVPWQYTPTLSGGSGSYTFGLSNAPSGMTVGLSSGTISWTPTEMQGPSTNNNITYAVYQSGATVAWTNFSVVVLESNLPPVFTNTPGTQTIYATTPLSVGDGATDPDYPANTLTYAIVAGPTGVGINPNTGQVSWTPTIGQVGTNTISVSVTDYNPWAVNSQSLSVTNSFAVIVKGLTPPSFTLQPSNQVVSAGAAVTFTAGGTGYPTPTYQWQFNGGNLTGATGSSYTIPASALTNIGYYTVVIANSAGTNTSASVSLTFLSLNMYAGLKITGPLNANYTVQGASALGGTNWSTLTNVSLPSQPYIYIDYSSPTNGKQFYRAVPQ